MFDLHPKAGLMMTNSDVFVLLLVERQELADFFVSAVPHVDQSRHSSTTELNRPTVDEDLSDGTLELVVSVV